MLGAGEQIAISFQDTLNAGLHRVFAVSEYAAVSSAQATQSTADRQILPSVFALSQNEPNPFGEGTLIRFAVPVKSQVMIEVFDVNGRRVRTLARGVWQPGYHAATWDGRDDRSRPARPGIYFYRMTAGSFRATRKMTLLP